MPRIARSTIEEVDSRTDMVALVGEYTRLEKRGVEYWGCCPFHHEKTPSFHVIPDRKMCHCFGCGAGGGPINFYRDMEKVSFAEAVVALAKKGGIEVVYEGGGWEGEKPGDNTRELYKDLYSRVAGSYRYVLTSTEEGEKARAYLESRGVSPEMQEKFKLGFAPRDRYWLKKFLRGKNYSDEFLAGSGLFSQKHPDISFFSDRLMYPIFDRMGQVVAFGGRILEGDGPKYLNSGELAHYHKKETLYAFNFAKQAFRTQKKETRYAIICEGYMDAIAYHQADITWAVATCGTALTEEQVKMLQSFVDTVYLSFDSDGAGQAATFKAINLFRKADMNVRVIQLGGGKDPAEILQNYGKKSLTDCIDGAILDSDFLLSTLSKRYNIQTPEGKKRASLDFFQYIDALQSDIQKESCFDQLCRAYQLNPEAVRTDYLKRTRQEKNSVAPAVPAESETESKAPVVDAEFRAVLSVAANMDFYPTVRNTLTAEDFTNPAARDLFITLEDCYREEAVGYDNILEHCANGGTKKLIAQAVTSGEYAVNTQQMIEDGVRTIRENSLKRKKGRLLNQLRGSELSGDRGEYSRLAVELSNEIMGIDSELEKLRQARQG